MKMASQSYRIDQLVSNSSGGVQNDQIPIGGNQPKSDIHPPHTSNIQAIFVPPFLNPPKGAFTYLNPVFNKHLQVIPWFTRLTIKFFKIIHRSIEISHLILKDQPPTTKPFMLDTVSQGKAGMDEHSTLIDKILLKRLNWFDAFMKNN